MLKIKEEHLNIMAAPRPDYEVIYGVGLLDDIHNYFPALLYDHNRFQSLTHVFHYIRHQMNTRFNLFAYGASRVQEQDSFPTIPTVILTPQAQSFAQAPPATQAQRPRPPPQEADVLTNLNTASLLLNLLAAPLTDLTPPTRGRLVTPPTPGLDAWFRQPVVVRPSTAVINSATELITGSELSGTTPSVCAICQDTIQPTASVRRLRHCLHVYHRGCIDQWFERSVVCPTCRHDIREA